MYTSMFSPWMDLFTLGAPYNKYMYPQPRELRPRDGVAHFVRDVLNSGVIVWQNSSAITAKPSQAKPKTPISENLFKSALERGNTVGILPDTLLPQSMSVG